MPSNAQVAREEDQAPNLQFEDIFSLRKPRDARAGLASGCKSMLKGVLAGSVGLVAAPLIGAHQEGVRGFAKGTAAGVAGAVVLPMCGFMIGSAQVVRGVINTPEAVRQTMLGRYWDDDTRTWIDAPSLALALDDDAVRRAWHSGAPRRGGGGGQNGSAAGHRGGSGPGSSGALVEGEESFYELLGVPQDASPELIKKQYYILARRLHPDKNPDDPQAKERFQRLGEAYQVLCNPELRRRYDMHGSEGLDINFMDAGEFFTALFGSQKFDHLVGELVIAAAARSGNELTPSQLKRLQLAREERLCVMLAALLRRWVEEDYSGFKESMAKEAAELASASFGEVMLHTVGSVYEAQAQIFLGGLINGSIAALKARGHSLKSQVTAASLALKVYQTQQQLEKLDKQQEQQQEVLRQQRQQQQQQTHESQQQQQQSEPQPGTSAPFWREGGGNAGPTSSSNPGSPGSRGGSGWSSPAGPSRQGSTFLGEVQPPAELNGRQSPQERRQVRSSAHPSAAAPGPGDAPTSPTAAAAAAAAAAASSAAAAAAAAASAAAAAEAAAAERARLEEQALPVMLDAMWAANVLDIEATLRHVCRRVLNDAQVSKHVRRKRASGLLELGRIFRAAKAPATNGVGSAGSSSSSPRCSRNRKAGQQQQQQRHQKTAKQHMEDAMMHVMEKRMQAADAQQ